MSELRTFNIQAHVEGKSGLTELRQLTSAIKDTDAATEALKKQLGEDTQVTVTNAKSKKELANEARRLLTQMQREERVTERLTRQYQNLATMTVLTKEEAEQYAAVSQLGSKATDAQREAVRQSVIEYQNLRNASGNTQGSLRNFRGVMQNLGWQVQDSVVQLQMGTDAFVVLSQQGSQMASAFGPTGAIVGALIALGGVIAGTLLTSLITSTKKTSELVDEMNKIASSTERVGKAQAELERQNVGQNIVELTRRYQNLQKQLKGTEFRYEQLKARYKEMDQDLSQTQVSFFESELANLRAELEGVEKGFEAAGGALSTLAGGQTTQQVKDYEKLIAELNTTYLSMSQSTEGSARATEDLRIMMMGLTDEQQKVIDGLITRNRAQEDAINQAKEQAELERKEATQFETLTRKLTKTVDDEYGRRLQVIRDYSDNVGADQDAVAKAYADLERWKTEELDKEEAKKTAILTREYNARETIRRQIERGVTRQARQDDPLQGEMDQFERNLMVLSEQKRQTDALGQAGLAERQRINALIEDEVLRHNAAMEDANLESLKNTVGVFSMAQSQVGSIVNLMTSGVQEVRNQVAEMNSFQKAMFITTQVIAAANAVINGIDLGMKLAAQFPLAAPAMIALGTGIGAAQAGTIAGVTIAGAFDKGGYIPSGSAGIVSEYGDEIANGQLIHGPARITSREDTARMLEGGSGTTELKLSIENKIPGATYRVEKTGPNDMKLIAEQVFADNIDSGVSQVLSNGNSKSAKAMRKSYSVQRNL